MNPQRDTIPERLASNPGVPLAAAAVALFSLNPLSPIRAGVDRVKQGIAWIHDGVRQSSSGGTVDAAPAAPIPSADADTPPAPVADPVAAPTPTPTLFFAPSASTAVLDALASSPTPSSAGAQQAFADVLAAAHAATVDNGPKYGAPSYWTEAGRLLTIKAVDGLDAAQRAARGMDSRTIDEVQAGINPGSIFRETSTPEPLFPGPPSPAPAGNDGDWWERITDPVVHVPGTPIVLPKDTDVSLGIGRQIVPTATDLLHDAALSSGQGLATASVNVVALSSGIVEGIAKLFGVNVNEKKSSEDLQRTKELLVPKGKYRLDDRVKSWFR